MALTARRLMGRRYHEIEPDAEGHQWDVEAIIGPVYTDGGFRNWDLYLTGEIIFAVPIGIGATIALPLPGAAGSIEQSERSRPAPAGGVIVDSGNSRWRRYPVDQLESIVMKRRSFGIHDLCLLRRSAFEADTYGIPPQSLISGYREALSHLYENIYEQDLF